MRSLTATILIFAVFTTVAQEPKPPKEQYSLRGRVHSVNTSTREITVASNRTEKHYRLLIEPGAIIRKEQEDITLEDLRKSLILEKNLKITALLEHQGEELPKPPYHSKRIALYLNEDEVEIEIQSRRRFLVCIIFSVDEDARKIVITSPDPKDTSKPPITTILTVEKNTEIWEQEKPHKKLSLADVATIVKEGKSIEGIAIVMDIFKEGENKAVHLTDSLMIRQKDPKKLPINPVPLVP